MADKQALNATFFAFRKRERGGVLLGATIAYVVLAFGMFGLFAFFNWQAMVDYFSWSIAMSDPANAPTDAAMIMPPPSVMSLLPMYGLIYIFTYILLASYEAACLRWMIRGEAPGLFGLTLGWDTWRVWFGYWIWAILFFVIYIVIVLVSMGIGIGAGVAVNQGDGATGGALFIALFVVIVAMLLAWLWVSIRLAPAAATSIARKRFAFFEAWKVTKGRFWGLLGAFLLLFLMFFVLCIVAAIGFGVAMAGAMSGMGAISDAESMAAMEQWLTTPATAIPIIVVYSLLILASMVFYVAMFGINARAAALALEEGKIKGPEAA